MPTALAAVVLLVGLLALLWAAQRSLIYFPYRDVPRPEALGLVDVEAVAFTTAEDLTLHGWFFPSRQSPARFTAAVFNGNAGNRAYRSPLATALRRQGLGVLLFDYRGYGENPGRPSEEGLAADGRAALAYLRGRPDVDPGRLVLFGESLGSAVALRLAIAQPPAALVLRSPFVSLVELGRLHYPWLPVRWLLRDRFLSIDRIGGLRSPLLVIGGDQDRIVPISQSRQLYDAAPPPKEMVVLPGAGHNDDVLLNGTGMIEAIDRFLQGVEAGA
jgi:hypothetical protein